MNNAKKKRTFGRWLYLASAIAAVFIFAAFLWLRLNNGQSDAAAPGDPQPGPQQERSAQARATIASTDSEPAHTVQQRALIYDPGSPLSPQLKFLRGLSDRHDPYATCVLAFALDLCARGPDRMIVDDYAHADPASLDQKSINRMAENFEFRERYANTCAGLDQSSFADMDRRLLQSARLGHVASMTRFALLPFRPGSNSEDPKSEFALAYRENAEAMLNRAAEAGDPEALRAIHNAYSNGYITSAMGTLEVEKDQAKSIAAYLAMSRYAGIDDRKIMEQTIEREVAQMSSAEVSRFSRLESLYSSPGRNNATDPEQGERVIDDFPEKACEARFGTE